MTNKYFRIRIVVICLLAFFLLENLLPVVAEGSEQAEQSWFWVNPLYLEEIVEPPEPQTLVRPFAVGGGLVSGNIAELKALLRDGLEARQAFIQIQYTGDFMDIKQLENIYFSLLEEDDYLKFNIRSANYGYKTSGSRTDVHFNMVYQSTAEQENLIDDKLALVLPTIITPGMNDHQKEKAIHDYIVKNVAYDEGYNPSSHSAYAALYDKVAVCQGYALLAYKMLSAAGVPVRCVLGEGGGSNHLWNLVCLDHNWYHLDCTWDDPTPDRPGKVIYNYYNLSDQEIRADHSWDAGSYPACKSSYYQELSNRLENDPSNYSLWQSLLTETGLDFLSPERTAENAHALEEKLHKSMLFYEASLELRFNSAGSNPKDLVNSAFGSAVKGTDCSNCNYQYTSYNRGGEGGYYLLEITFTYRNNAKGWLPWKEEKTVGRDHPYWTVAFSQALDFNSVNCQNIFIGSDPGGKIPLPGIPAPQLVGTNQVRLYPPQGQQWDPGSYYLFIGPGVKSAGNKSLEQGVRMKFTIQ